VRSVALRVLDEDRTVHVDVATVVICGYTGRDPAAVERHIAELEAIGVARPASVPEVTVLDGEVVTQAARIGPYGGRSSGEAEPVLVFGDGEWFLTVGSDHTDRDLERTDMRAAKAACEKPIARAAWSSGFAAPAWDDLRLRSFAGPHPGTAYQDAMVSSLAPCEALVELIAAAVDDLDGTVGFCGTVPVLTGDLRFAAEWRVELVAPSGAAIACDYVVGPGA
jgi:hypothetical protein